MGQLTLEEAAKLYREAIADRDRLATECDVLGNAIDRAQEALSAAKNRMNACHVALLEIARVAK